MFNLHMIAGLAKTSYEAVHKCLKPSIMRLALIELRSETAASGIHCPDNEAAPRDIRVSGSTH